MKILTNMRLSERWMIDRFRVTLNEPEEEFTRPGEHLERIKKMIRGEREQTEEPTSDLRHMWRSS